MSHLYFNEQSDYSDENTCGNEVFRLPFLTISVWAWTDESAAALLHIRIGNLQKALQKWSVEIWLMIKRNKEIDCFCCREVDTMLIVSDKIPEREGASCDPVFMGICLTSSHTC